MASPSAWTAKGLGGTTALRAIPAEFVERVRRSLKHEEVYLRAYASVSEARVSIGRYLDFYNRRHPHQELAMLTPDQALCNALQQIPAAA